MPPNKAVILKVFTKELILNSIPGLKEKIKERIKTGRKIKELASSEVFKTSLIHPVPTILPPPELPSKPISPPTPTFAEIAGINFGKLTPFIQNPAINMIECPGENKNIIIRTYNIRRPTPIILSKDEMQDLVLQFSKKAKVPFIDGLFRAWIDKYLISALISNKQTQNFIIQKIIYPHFA